MLQKWMSLCIYNKHIKWKIAELLSFRNVFCLTDLKFKVRFMNIPSILSFIYKYYEIIKYFDFSMLVASISRFEVHFEHIFQQLNNTVWEFLSPVGWIMTIVWHFCRKLCSYSISWNKLTIINVFENNFRIFR